MEIRIAGAGTAISWRSINQYTTEAVRRIEFVVVPDESGQDLPGSDLYSMKVTEKDVAYVADLANLELTEQERAEWCAI